MDDVEGLLLWVTYAQKHERNPALPKVPLATDLQEAIRSKEKAKC
jgi:hypothetical protein